MINVKMTIGNEEIKAMSKIAVNSEKNKENRKRSSIIYLVLSLVFVFYGVVDIVKKNVTWLTYCDFIAIVFFVLFATVGLKFIQRFAVEMKLLSDNKKQDTNEIEYTISEKGIVTKKGNYEGLSKWNAFNTIIDYSHYVSIQKTDFDTILIDKNKLSESEIIELEQYLKILQSEEE